MQKIHHSRFLKKTLGLLMAKTRKAIHGLSLHSTKKSRIEGHKIKSSETMETTLVKENQKILNIAL